MCVICIKYLPEYGWVAGKNRDRSYKPEIHIKQSFRKGVERCLLWDTQTKWTEGVNEFGVGILNTTLYVKKDESAGDKQKTKRVFYSPSGKSIRTALLEKTPEAAMKSLIKTKMEGFTFIFSKNEAYLIESPHVVSINGDLEVKREYEYEFIKLDKKKTYVRTNHGIIFTKAGYPEKSPNPKYVKGRSSSESRYDIVHKAMKSVKEPMDILKALSQQPNKNPQMNPLRTSKTHGKTIMVTTGQILLIPSENTLHYRPIWGGIVYNTKKLDDPNSKTWFEIISSRKLLTIKESIGTFRQFCNR